jgi:hypothetical protein
VTSIAALLVAAAPCLYWTQGIESRAAVEAAGIKRLCVAPEQADVWRRAGFEVTPTTQLDFDSREALAAPGITPRAGLASPTRSPWIVANGWRFVRSPDRRYSYAVPAGKGAIAAAEAFAYGADAVLRIDPGDLPAVGAILAFLDSLPSVDLPAIADLAVVDDGSALTGEVMNLLARRNLLFRVVKTPSPDVRINVAVGTPAYPAEEAADPSAFALKVRRQITDEQRSLRVFGSEVVIARLTGDGNRMRLHLLNYAGREIEGLRVRLRGVYPKGEAFVTGSGRVALADHVAADGATEFSVPSLATYAVVDLRAR